MVQRRKRTRRVVVLALVMLLPLFLQGSAEAHIWPKGYSTEDAEMIAKTVWGEARNASMTEQAAVVWCILNRVDSNRFPNSIKEVIEREGQFLGYASDNPIEDEIMSLTYDVLARWSIEKSCIADVGRLLPADYVFFLGDGETNIFYSYNEDEKPWDWRLDSPYESSPSSTDQLATLRKILLLQESRSNPLWRASIEDIYQNGKLSPEQAVTRHRLNHCFDMFEKEVSKILTEHYQR